MLKLLETADEATPEWFTQMFQQSGLDVTVSAVESAPVGTGQMAENARFALTYAGSAPNPSAHNPGAAQAPTSLVGKFPSQDPQSRAAGAQGAYAKEVRFYQELADTVAVATPKCWFAGLAEDEIGFTLMMEDLAPAVQGDQIEGCTLNQAADAVRNVAGLHGPRWSDETLFDLTGLARPRDPEGAAFLGELMGALTPGFISRYRSHLTDQHVEILDLFATNVQAWAMRETDYFAPLHGDYRLDNLLFGPAGHAPPVSAVDWQTLNLGSAVNDVSYFLGNGLLPDQRRSEERALVAEYHQALQTHGVDLTAEACFEEYRWGSFHGPLITVLGSMMVVQTDRGDHMFMAMIHRSLQQIIDLEAVDLIR